MFSHIKELFTRPSGYTISRSVRLRSSASAYLNRTPASATNRTTWTWSGWVKRGSLGTAQMIFQANAASGTTDNDRFLFYFNSSNQLEVDGAVQVFRVTNAVFRDPSAWYHIVLTVDTGNATTNNRMLLYVNGVSQSFSTNYALSSSQLLAVNGVYPHYFSYLSGSSFFFDGYLTEINFIDGQALTPSSFGETDSITGVWKAKKYSGTYGTNGFYLNFSDNSGATATTIGKDYSGNGNNWTPNNISVTAGVTYDSMIDVPTPYADGGNGRGNYCVLNPLRTRNSPTISYANLRLDGAGASHKCAVATFELQGGVKIYAEATVLNTTSGSQPVGFGFTDVSAGASLPAPSDAGGYIFYGNANGNIYNGTTLVTSSLGAPSAGTVLQIAYNPSNGKAWVGKGNVWYNSTGSTTGDPANDANATFTLSTTLLNVLATAYDTNSLDLNFGQRPFTYTPPSGFVALNTQNLPDSTIKNGGQYMSAVLYTGDGNTNRSITGVGFQTDFNWTKSRSSASYSHQLADSVRGWSKYLYSNATNAEGTDATNHIQSVNSDGYVINSGASFNASGVTYVAWDWKAGGSSSSNTNGSITSTVSVGATQGFSVVTYTGTGANATVGHGLGVAPSMIILKSRVSATNWVVYHANLTSAAYVIQLNLTNAQSSSPTIFNSTAPTSSVFSIGTSSASNDTSMVAYCFAAVKGFSAFGSYTGNGSTDGPFVFTGFRPRWLLVKSSTAAQSWQIYDSSRDSINQGTYTLFANGSNAESSTNGKFDFLSNGFKMRDGDFATNKSAETYIYYAVAENPFRNALAR